MTENKLRVLNPSFTGHAKWKDYKAEELLQVDTGFETLVNAHHHALGTIVTVENLSAEGLLQISDGNTIFNVMLRYLQVLGVKEIDISLLEQQNWRHNP